VLRRPHKALVDASMLLAAELGRPLKGTAKKLPSKPSHGHEGMWTAQARPRMGEATKGGVNFAP